MKRILHQLLARLEFIQLDLGACMWKVTFLLHVFVRPVDCGDLNSVVALLIHCYFFRDAFVREKWILFEFLKILSEDEMENGVVTNSIEKPLLMSSFSTTSIDAKFSRIWVSCSARLSARMGWFNKVVTQKLGIYQIVYYVCHVCVLRSNLGDRLCSLFVHWRSQLVELDLDLHDFFRSLVVYLI